MELQRSIKESFGITNQFIRNIGYVTKIKAGSSTNEPKGSDRLLVIVIFFIGIVHHTYKFVNESQTIRKNYNDN